jgi:hypothetical protein
MLSNYTDLQRGAEVQPSYMEILKIVTSINNHLTLDMLESGMQFTKEEVLDIMELTSEMALTFEFGTAPRITFLGIVIWSEAINSERYIKGKGTLPLETFLLQEMSRIISVVNTLTRGER